MESVRKTRKMMYRKSTLIHSLKKREDASLQRRKLKLSPTRGMSWRKTLLYLTIQSQSSSAFFLYLSRLAWFSSKSRSLPPLDPGTLPNSYITFGKTLNDAPLAVRDLDAERMIGSSSALSAPAPAPAPPELTKSGKPLTKKEKKAVCRS